MAAVTVTIGGVPVVPSFAGLAPGWVGVDFDAAFAGPVKLINDAAMQALGSYEGGKMLFLGLGTGLGADLLRRPRRRSAAEDKRR